MTPIWRRHQLSAHATLTPTLIGLERSVRNAIVKLSQPNILFAVTLKKSSRTRCQDSHVLTAEWCRGSQDPHVVIVVL